MRLVVYLRILSSFKCFVGRVTDCGLKLNGCKWILRKVLCSEKRLSLSITNTSTATAAAAVVVVVVVDVHCRGHIRLDDRGIDYTT